MKKTILIIALILGSYYLLGMGVKKTIPEDAIRLRILANSNSEYDQEIKGNVKVNIQKEIYNILKKTNDIDSARTLLKNNIDKLNNSVSDTLSKVNYPYDFNINYGYNYFPDKEYDGVIYPAGYYESILITLGSGEGDNWWCVLFPPMCLLEAEETEEVEYKLWIQEMIDKYL